MKVWINRIAVFVLSLCMTVSVFAFSGEETFAADNSAESSSAQIVPDTSWYNTSDTTFTITTPQQLAGLAAIVDGTAEGITQTDFSGKEIDLESDIDLGNSEWEPIGKAVIDEASGSFLKESADNRSFDGTFNGNYKGKNYKISNMNISGDGSGVALFAYTGSNSVIENLTVEGTVTGSNHVGGIVSVCSGKITDVTSNVTIKNGKENVFDVAGGIAAEAVGKGTVINGCINKGMISNSSNAEEKSSGKVGGILGKADTDTAAEISECGNEADITAYQYAAGIIGGQFGNVDVKACYNIGDITAVSFGKVYLGGIAGKSSGGTITNCYNRGNLYDGHWSAGHIRAVGGIAGCEEGRADASTAITKCYNTGLIELDTSKMIYGTNWIYEVGNISGGNSTTSANQMKYENCCFLENRIPAADSSSASYKFWADIYKTDNSIWDTSYNTKCTESEMKSAAFVSRMGTAFYQDTNNVNGGYPTLYWQSGEKYNETPYSVSSKIYGSDTAKIEGLSDKYSKGDKVTFTVGGLGSRQVTDLKVNDMTGRSIEVTKTGGAYEFEMPGRNTDIVVYIGRTTSSSEKYKVDLPTDLDGIWNVDFDSYYKDGNKVTEGATVVVKVTRANAAMMSSLKGITVTATADGRNAGIESTYKYYTDSSGSGRYGEYAFTMPAMDVTITPELRYSPVTVCEQKGMNGTAKEKKSYSRDDMLKLASPEPIYYSGYSTETDPFIGKAEQAVKLKTLMADAGLTMNANSVLKLTSIDGMDMYFTYAKLYGSERDYYPNIISGTTAEEQAKGKTPIDAMLVIKGNTALKSEGVSVDSKTADTLNAYRFVYGQTAEEFSSQTKIVDSMPKYVSSITVIDNTPAATPVCLKRTAVTLRAGSKKITAVWKKVANAGGYQIYRSLQKTSGFKRIKTIAGGSRVKYTNGNLKKGRRYYYKVRAYKKTGGKTYYSSWSAVRGARAK